METYGRQYGKKYGGKVFGKPKYRVFAEGCRGLSFNIVAFKPGSCHLSAAPYLCIVKQVGLDKITYAKKEKSECPGKDEDKLLGIKAFPKLASALGRLKKLPHTHACMRLYNSIGI